MTYAARADMEARFGASELTDLGDAARMSAALADAAAEIDASIAQMWTLPLAATATYPLLAGLQCDLARARLYDEAVPETVSAAATAARDTLGRLREGALALIAVTDGAAAAVPRRTVKVEVPDRVFTDAAFEGF